MLHRALATVLVLGAFGAAVPAAGVALPRIANGVTVGGIPVGGLTTEAARSRIADRYGQPIHFYSGGDSWSASPTELGADAAVQRALVKALRARRNARIPLEVGVDAASVRRYVATVAKRYRQPAVDAKLVGLKNLAPSFTPARDGRRVDQRTFAREIERALRSSFRGGQLKVPIVPVKPKATSADFGPIVVVRRSSNKLYLYDGATLTRTFGVATGQAKYPTPLGQWHVVTMQRNPWWIPPDSDWAKNAKPIPPGPGNPLGTRWMGLDAAGVGIHGTPDAASIGYSASHGCIRMRIPDAEALFTLIDVGTPVYIVDA